MIIMIWKLKSIFELPDVRAPYSIAMGIVSRRQELPQQVSIFMGCEGTFIL
jgi:hypothetical protein